ncbi:MAG TPA: hypothetical protein VFW41_11795 [Gaiellaceae bacterium]|nr:hypothetical protein [Gaiellaceae bacterium]
MRLPTDITGRYLARVADAEPCDLVSKLAALQLNLANSRFLFRIEAAIQLIAQSDPSGGQSAITAERLAAWLAGSPFQSFEDPFNNTFTEEVMFVGGSYVVFPGPSEQALFIFRHLTRALFLGADWPEARAYLRDAVRLAGACLRLSDEVARRAALTRGLAPKFSPNLVVPRIDLLGRESALLQFSVAELDQLLGDLGGFATLTPLVQEPVAVPGLDDWGDGLFYSHPLVRFDDVVVVALPHELILALNHALISGAVEAGLADELASRFREAVFATIHERLTENGIPQAAVDLPVPDGFPGFSRVFGIDSDKAAHVLLLSDDLTGYDRDAFDAPWQPDGLNEQLEEIVNAAARTLYEQPGINDVLHLIVSAPVGRTTIFGLQDRPEDLPGKLFALSAGDLEVITLLEHDRLALWKYGVAHDRVRERTRIMVFSALDEFGAYRTRDYSYYLADDARPDFLSISPDGAAPLKAEIQEKFDFHGAKLPERSAITTVAALHGERRIPIYVPFSRTYRVPQLLVEGFALPVWVVAEYADDTYRGLTFSFCDMTAYWLWQLQGSIPVFDAGAELDGDDEFIVRVQLTPDEAWFGSEADDDGQQATDPFIIVTNATELTITVSPLAVAEIARSDNALDRVLVRALVESLAQLSNAAAPTAEQVTDIVDRVAPLGLKKKISSFHTAADPRLDDTGLPDYRGVQEPNNSLLLDDVGAALEQRGFVEGDLDRADAQRALHATVAFLFERLEATVASLSPDGLLETLVAQAEAVVSHQAQRDHAVPTELHCFSTVPEMAERLRKEIPAVALAATASRFLVEYVTARPPRGARPLSMDLYDELLALAAEIFDKGIISDSIQYELTDVEVSILPSQRLGFSRGTQWERGRDAFLEVHARSEIVRRGARLVASARRPDRNVEAPEEMDELDQAVEGEYGIGLRDLVDFHMELINAGWRRQGEPKIALRAELIEELARELGWSEEKVEQAIDLHVLEERPSYLDMPNGLPKWEAFPWAFNRTHSYVRRPLLARGDELIWGARHVYVASRFFVDLAAGGRLQARTKRLIQIINRWRQRDAREFNDRVAALYKSQRLPVLVRVKKIGGLRIARESGETISDIDVLVADLKKRRLIVTETKSLVVGRTAWELKNERIDTFVGQPGKKSEIDKLKEVTDWVKDHRAEVLQALGIDEQRPQRWQVKPLMVVENELLTPYLVDVGLPVLSFQELRERIESGRLI